MYYLENDKAIDSVLASGVPHFLSQTWKGGFFSAIVSSKRCRFESLLHSRPSQIPVVWSSSARPGLVILETHLLLALGLRLPPSCVSCGSLPLA